jgi:hypothetical protein
MQAMKTDERIDSLRIRLRRQLFRWGIVPVLAVGFLSLGTSAVQASNIDPTTRQAELRLQGAMALAAAAFLAGFWIEGYRTATERVMRRIASRLGVPLRELTRDRLCAASEAVEHLIIDAHRQAVVLGWGAVVAVAVAAFAGMPPSHCAIVLVIALLDQLYMFSRQHHAVEVMAGVVTGELAEDAQELAKRDEFKPTLLQRFAMWFGWRPPLEPQTNPRKRRHKTRR